MPDSPFRDLPSVDAVLTELLRTDEGLPRAVARDAAREAVATARTRIRAGDPAPMLDDVLFAAERAAQQALRPSLRRVINATGVLLQTNLGRAPLSERAIAAMDEVARGYSNLEFDLDAGERGSRHDHVRALLRRVTGAEDALVVNNNAVALLMVLQVLAAPGAVAISRGQAVEIGGGFRIPDIVAQSGARIIEVGTTNRTYARDYAAALGEDAAAILRVHSSNFRIVGFTAQPSVEELVSVAAERGVRLFDDLGSGCLVDTTRYGMTHEPTVQESLRAGVDLVLFSGDKLLGGPQCGIIAGRAPLVERLRKHPLARALRVDKLTIAALNATLTAYVAGSEASEIPVWRMLSIPPAALRRRAGRWAREAGGEAAVVAGRSMVGGGSLPGEGVPTWLTAVRSDQGASQLARALRSAPIPIVARIEHDRVLLDPRTVEPRDDAAVARALAGLSSQF